MYSMVFTAGAVQLSRLKVFCIIVGTETKLTRSSFPA